MDVVITKDGPSGGEGGNYFEDTSDAQNDLSKSVTRVGIRVGDIINYVEMFIDGETLGGHGGNNGSCESFDLHRSEILTGITGYWGGHGQDTIVRFLTLTATDLNTGLPRSKDYGKEKKGNFFQYIAEPNSEIIGLFGTSGDVLDRLGVKYRERPH